MAGSDRSAPAAGPMAVLVLGMHRSGTSALTRFIGGLGASLPQLTFPPGEDNPEGFWEPAGLVRLNDRLLHALGSSWLDLRPLDLAQGPFVLREEFAELIQAEIAREFFDSPCFVLKDPRICRLVPLYRDVLARAGAQPRVVLVLRDPHEVAASLAVRNHFSHGYAALLWARHVLDSERETRDLPRVVVAFDEALRDGPGTAARIRGLLGVASPDGDDSAVAGLLRPELRHHVGRNAAILDPEIAGPFEFLHQAMLGLRVADTAESRRQVDVAAQGVQQLMDSMRDVMGAEFVFQNLTYPESGAVPPREVPARREFAAAMHRLQMASRGQTPWWRKLLDF